MRRVTIKDIAALAGVSYATVSRALSGSSEISEQTRARILNICRQEGYRANVLARSLICSRTNVLGLVIPDITNPFYAELALNVETYAHTLGYSVMLCNSLPDDPTEEIPFEFLVGHQVDGILLASSRSGTHELIRKYLKVVPTVLLGDSITEDDAIDVNAVSVDNRAGGRLAADYLCGLGHKRIIYLGARPGSTAHQLRLRGFQSALAAHGLSVHVLENTADKSSIEHGYTLCKQLFTRGLHGATAVFAATDSMALGVLQAADEFGIRVPADLSLLGFDNILYSALPKIKLSTVDQRKQALAEAAVNLLVKIIETPASGECTRRLIKPALVTRSSCRQLP